MPFLNADKLCVTVDFPVGTVAVRGSSIVGTVFVTATEDVDVRGVVLQYVCVVAGKRAGAAAAERSVQAPTPDEAQARLAALATFRRRVYAAEYVLLGSRYGSPVRVRAGRYVYPVAIPVPADLPPTVFPTDFGRGENGSAHGVVSVKHALKLRVVIPMSLFDNKSEWPFGVASIIEVPRVVSAAPVAAATAGNSRSGRGDPQDLFRPIVDVKRVVPASCTWLPRGLAWACCARSARHVSDYILIAPCPVVAVDRTHTVEFVVEGRISTMAVVQLVRTARMSEWSCANVAVVASSRPFGPLARATEGSGASAAPAFRGSLSFPPGPVVASFAHPLLTVSYALELHLSFDDGCCVAARAEDVARVPLRVFHSAVESSSGGDSDAHAWPPAAVAATSAVAPPRRAGAMGGESAAQPQQPPRKEASVLPFGDEGTTTTTNVGQPRQRRTSPPLSAGEVPFGAAAYSYPDEDDPSEVNVFAYVPPQEGQFFRAAGGGGSGSGQPSVFSPAAPVTESALPPATWGVVLDLRLSANTVDGVPIGTSGASVGSAVSDRNARRE